MYIICFAYGTKLQGIVTWWTVNQVKNTQRLHHSLLQSRNGQTIEVSSINGNREMRKQSAPDESVHFPPGCHTSYILLTFFILRRQMGQVVAASAILVAHVKQHEQWPQGMKKQFLGAS